MRLTLASARRLPSGCRAKVAATSFDPGRPFEMSVIFSFLEKNLH
jgi:hypothetical protein